MPGKCTESVKVWLPDDLHLRCSKLANIDDRALSEWIRVQLSAVCELHDRGVDITVGMVRRSLSPDDDGRGE